MRKHLSSLIPVFFVVFMLLVPVANAQQIDFDFQDIISKLGPRTGDLLILDILIYLIFGIGFITMLLVPDKQLFPSLLMVGVIGLAVVAKIGVFSPLAFATFVINVGIFVGPLVVAGMVRERGRRPRAMLPGILTGLLGGAHFFLFWALLQNR